MVRRKKAINKVRQRAAWPGKEAGMTITEAQCTMDMLMEERGRELVGEQGRWQDLKRWGKLVERVKLQTHKQQPSKISIICAQFRKNKLIWRTAAMSHSRKIWGINVFANLFAESGKRMKKK